MEFSTKSEALRDRCKIYKSSVQEKFTFQYSVRYNKKLRKTLHLEDCIIPSRIQKILVLQMICYYIYLYKSQYDVFW